MIKRFFHSIAIKKAFDRVCAEDSAGLQKLLDSGVSADANRCYDKTDIQQSLLLCAVENKAYGCADTLLAAGADPNLFNDVGSSPFGWALHGMSRVISDNRLEFTAALPYETHPVMGLVAKMFILGGDRHYRPPGFVERTALDFGGPSQASQKFEAMIDAWLHTQSARLRYQGFDRDTTKPASGPGAPIPRM